MTASRTAQNRCTSCIVQERIYCLSAGGRGRCGGRRYTGSKSALPIEIVEELEVLGPGVPRGPGFGFRSGMSLVVVLVSRVTRDLPGRASMDSTSSRGIAICSFLTTTTMRSSLASSILAMTGFLTPFRTMRSSTPERMSVTFPRN